MACSSCGSVSSTKVTGCPRVDSTSNFMGSESTLMTTGSCSGPIIAIWIPSLCSIFDNREMVRYLGKWKPPIPYITLATSSLMTVKFVCSSNRFLYSTTRLFSWSLVSLLLRFDPGPVLNSPALITTLSPTGSFVNVSGGNRAQRWPWKEIYAGLLPNCLVKAIGFVTSKFRSLVPASHTSASNAASTVLAKYSRSRILSNRFPGTGSTLSQHEYGMCFFPDSPGRVVLVLSANAVIRRPHCYGGAVGTTPPI
jgi:hypothetical protein